MITLVFFIDGLIELQIEGERNAFLSAKNKNHKGIDFVGFKNGGIRTSNWLIGCPIEREAERRESYMIHLPKTTILTIFACFTVCTQRYSTEINETDFTTFFDIHSISQNRPSSDIKLTVYVEATRDVSILLSPVDSYSVESRVPSYEIRIASGDKQKDYQLHRNHERLVNNSESNLLQPNARVPVEIIIKIGTFFVRKNSNL